MAATSAAPILAPSGSAYGNGHMWREGQGNTGDDVLRNDQPIEATDLPNGDGRDHANWRNDTSHPTNSDRHRSRSPKKARVEDPRSSGQASSSIAPPTFEADNVRSSSFEHEDREDGRDSRKRHKDEMYGRDPDDVASKWIHRDKLAKIESEELQAAGIILPKSRSRSRPSTARANGQRKTGDADSVVETRSRKNSVAVSEVRTSDSLTPSWDLRHPEEIAANPNIYFSPGTIGGKGASRIPLAKLSPAPVPQGQVERAAPLVRHRDGSPSAGEPLSFAKTRSRSGSRKGAGADVPVKRSATDASPKKTTTAARKTSAPAAKSAVTPGRPKTRSGGKEQIRPTTRSGERELSPGAASKQPEGEPPWMVSAYRPDPRLPPDQQLLPTVARRLQQEKWEKEGKFGNIYDKDFRPLNEEGYLKPPEGQDKAVDATEEEATEEATEEVMEEEKPTEWPLKPEAVKSPPLSPGRAGSYSTIPRIPEKVVMSPLPSPRVLPPESQATVAPQAAPKAEQPEPEQKDGCGCCVVM